MILRFISAITFLFLPLWIGIATLGIYMISEKVKGIIDEIQQREAGIQQNIGLHQRNNAKKKDLSGRHSLPARFTTRSDI